VNFKFPGFSFFSSFHLTSPLLSLRSVKAKEYDAIVAHGTYTCFTARALFRGRGVPYFAFIWDPITYILRKVYTDKTLGKILPILMRMGNYLDSFLTNEAMAVLTCSDFHRARLKKVTDRNIEKVYPGCNPVAEAPIKKSDYIVSVDRWDIGNKPHKLLDLFEYLPKDAKMRIAGFWYPPDLYTSFLLEIRRKHLEDRVFVEGPADKARLTELFTEARALIHPIEEVFGFVPHEAASCGCPFIMPKTSGNAEVYTHGYNCFLSDAWHPEEIAGYATKLLEDESLSLSMGRRAWEMACRYTWKDHAKELARIIEKYVS
jgi:glycosyltransferase involved in cell wall biosynthesis